MSRLTSTAVMNRRALGPESLDYFPTPPWATRAFLREVLIPKIGGGRLLASTCLEPCCGEGHMVAPLREVFAYVGAADYHDYGQGFPVADILDQTLTLPPADWVITNPPFNAASQIARRVLDSTGVHSLALLCRLNWAEGKDRHREIFERRPPSLIAISADRIPMIEGAYDPDADTATAYAWFVWLRGLAYGKTETVWIAPVHRSAGSAPRTSSSPSRERRRGGRPSVRLPPRPPRGW